MLPEATVPITVAIVEDNPDYRLGISYVLRASPGVSVLGEYASAEALFEALPSATPDVVLMDLGLPGMTGVGAIERLRALAPRVQPIVLSVHEDDDHVFRAVCAGAVGYLTKPVMPAALLEAIEAAFGGGTPMSPHVARRVLDMFRKHAPPPHADYDLTAREVDVLERLVEGRGYKEIADALFISVYTVRAHLRNIYEKLHVHSKSQAVSKALQEGLLPRK